MNKKQLESLTNLRRLGLFLIGFFGIWYLDDIRHKLLGAILIISVFQEL